ncbi:competence protein CoiA [Staphylococcus aureus]|nr:competence protein CoiA [Staphylococcus aureus]MBH4697481.1 competence protein CoiA [Staphylococcus aureus]MBH4702648.1 competence protein CoiA [Staphylococcus aureus]MBH4705289.1 competence protein CoiA [Staphylococcus aureus]MBH4707843.1 competence protein CoiA [Staphylococcus aureus]
MLVALNEEKERVLATTALRKTQYFCPVCGKQVILKRGLKVISHFAHKHLAEQKCFNNETIKHYKSKLILAQMIQQQGCKVEIEPFLKEIKQIPDILINNKYVIELQYSPIPYKQILQRTEGLKKMGYKVSWLLNDVDYCHNKVKFNHFQSMFINPITRKLHTFNLEKKQIMMFQQIQYLGGHKYVAEKRNAKISELFNEAPCDYHVVYKLSKFAINQYIKYCRWQNSVLEPTLSAMYQLQLTDQEVGYNYGYIFPEQIYIENHPIEWQLQVDLWLKNGKSKLVNDNLNYFKLKKFIVALESKTAIIEKLINNYLNICSDRGNDVQILF